MPSQPKSFVGFHAQHISSLVVWILLLVTVLAAAEKKKALREQAPPYDGSGSVAKSWARNMGTSVRGLEISSAFVAVMGVLTTIHQTLQKIFIMQPGIGCCSYVVLLGVFCWTMLSFVGSVSSWPLALTWFDPGASAEGARDGCVLLHEIGATKILCNLFTCNMMLISPLILLVPVPEMARRVTQKIGAAIGTNCLSMVADEMAKFKAWFVRLYAIIFIVEVANAFFIWEFAKTNDKIMASMAEESKGIATDWASWASSSFLMGNTTLGRASSGHAGKLAHSVASADPFGSLDQGLMPPCMVFLYLVLVWCELIIVYDRLTGRSFQEDMPWVIFVTIFPCLKRCEPFVGKAQVFLGKGQEIAAKVSEAQTLVQQGPAFVAIVQGELEAKFTECQNAAISKITEIRVLARTQVFSSTEAISEFLNAQLLRATDAWVFFELENRIVYTTVREHAVVGSSQKVYEPIHCSIVDYVKSVLRFWGQAEQASGGVCSQCWPRRPTSQRETTAYAKIDDIAADARDANALLPDANFNVNVGNLLRGVVSEELGLLQAEADSTMESVGSIAVDELDGLLDDMQAGIVMQIGTIKDDALSWVQYVGQQVTGINEELEKAKQYVDDQTKTLIGLRDDAVELNTQAMQLVTSVSQLSFLKAQWWPWFYWVLWCAVLLCACSFTIIVAGGILAFWKIWDIQTKVGIVLVLGPVLFILVIFAYTFAYLAATGRLAGLTRPKDVKPTVSKVVQAAAADPQLAQAPSSGGGGGGGGGGGVMALPPPPPDPQLAQAQTSVGVMALPPPTCSSAQAPAYSSAQAPAILQAPAVAPATTTEPLRRRKRKEAVGVSRFQGCLIVFGVPVLIWLSILGVAALLAQSSDQDRFELCSSTLAGMGAKRVAARTT